jgi:hypothetical protein
MSTLETAIEADTETLHVLAESYPNVDVVYKAYGDALPHRWEVQLIEPRQSLGTIELTALEISLPDTDRRKELRVKFLGILEATGHDR